ncbi:MAG: hypothetical protein HYX45_11800 [Burkholderiales bacterium]|nr:hypothetical protein [Burkholderiales bacterium]
MTHIWFSVRFLFCVIATLLVALACAALAVEAYYQWVMWEGGISDRSELSEAYGNAFFGLLYGAVTFFISLPIAGWGLWRLLKLSGPNSMDG